jgi:hypothetical protein
MKHDANDGAGPAMPTPLKRRGVREWRCQENGGASISNLPTVQIDDLALRHTYTQCFAQVKHRVVLDYVAVLDRKMNEI